MTVKELIAYLKGERPDAEVYILNNQDESFNIVKIISTSGMDDDDSNYIEFKINT